MHHDFDLNDKVCYNKSIMDDDKILELTGKIESTLGQEQFATISDTIGELLTGNTINRQTIAEKDEEIKKLKDKNEKLVSANGALLQKLPMKKLDEPKEEQSKPKSISLKDAFDSKGNFLR